AAAQGAPSLSRLRRAHRHHGVRHHRRHGRRHSEGRNPGRSPRSATRLAAFHTNAADFPPNEPAGNFPAPPSTIQATSPVNLVNPITCAANGNPYPYYVASDTAIFIGGIVAAAAEAAYDIIPTLAPAWFEVSFVHPGKAIAATIAEAARYAVLALE